MHNLRDFPEKLCMKFGLVSYNDPPNAAFEHILLKNFLVLPGFSPVMPGLGHNGKHQIAKLAKVDWVSQNNGNVGNTGAFPGNKKMDTTKITVKTVISWGCGEKPFKGRDFVTVEVFML